MMKYMFSYTILGLNVKSNFYWMILQGFFCLMFISYIMHTMFFNNDYGMNLNTYEDLLSFMMILLLYWLSIYLMLSSNNMRLNYQWRNFCLMIFLSFFSLFMLFIVDNLFYFYIFFELGALPTLMMIIRFGYQPERWRAGIYLIFYTFIGSLPFFICVLWFEFKSLNNGFFLMPFIFDFFYYKMFCLGCILAFVVKLPIYGLHIWLPKAHVEAPIAGSMLLAGILLKLGGYGLLRFIPLFNGLLNINGYLVSWGIMGGLLISLVTMRQSDLKCFIAYSSVSHMSMMLGAMMIYNSLGGQISIYLMVSHGLISCGMFCLASVFYERTMSRSIMMLGGGMRFVFSGSLFWFMVLLMNLGMPPFLSFFCELLIFISLMMWWGFFIFLSLFIIFQFSGVINLYYYILMNNEENIINYKYNTFNIREMYLIILMLLPIMMMIFLLYGGV